MTALLADDFLAIAADIVDDLERTRIANENRLRQLTRSVEDSDGKTRGFGYDPEDPTVSRVSGLVEGLASLEADATKNLQRAMKDHPLGPWVKAQKGIGEKQAARLLAAIGDPYWNFLHDRPRTVSELWAYCGYKPGQKRKKGVKANWSADAKMRVFLISTSCIKSGGPYREVYDARKAHTEGRLHTDDCVRCGPAGNPAKAGSLWSDGHRHSDAIRVMSKAILRDLWREAKRIHETS